MADDRTGEHEEGALDAFGAHTDAALTIVTTADGVERSGCLVGFHSQCSIGPDRYALWLSKANRTYRVAMFAEHLAVHLLGTGDHELARLFGGTSGDEVDKFARCAWTTGPGGVPLLDDLPNRLVGRRVSLLDEQDCDHVCIVLVPDVVETTSPFEPLRLSMVDDLDPGHDASDRPVPSTLDA